MLSLPCPPDVLRVLAQGDPVLNVARLPPLDEEALLAPGHPGTREPLACDATFTDSRSRPGFRVCPL